MSKIGDIYARYGEALDWSLDDFSQEKQRAFEAMRDFYPLVFSNFVRDFSWIRNVNDQRRHRTLQILREQFGQGEGQLNFAAIDGTCDKKQLSELLVFYGGSYAQVGSLAINEKKGQLKYNRWAPTDDTSVIAYLPVPLNRLQLFEDEEWLFRADDENRATTHVIHTSLMQLAEIYLTYKKISDDRPPKIILLDHSLSSILLSSDVMHLIHPYEPERQTLGWIGAYIERWGRMFEPADGLVAHAHPMNWDLSVPTGRLNSFAEALVAELTRYWQIGMAGERDEGQPIALDDFFKKIGFFEKGEEERQRLINRIKKASAQYKAFKLEGNQIIPINKLYNDEKKTLKQRWYDLRLLFEFICERLFRERRTEALQLRYASDSQRQGYKWMDDNDIRFLIGVGLRLLIELCWDKKILLMGVVKDSASRYFTKNFLSVLDSANIVNISKTPEPPGSDRLVCEMASLIDENLSAPWATVEFDAVFMTLRALKNINDLIEIRGVKGDVIVPSDGLFLKSLVTLFLERRSQKKTPLMAHALFLDRIAYPYFDANCRSTCEIVTRDSLIHPFLFENKEIENLGQDITMLVADLLTRNCFPQAIGQPDPLHRADLGAKSLGKQINHLVNSSVQKLKINPLNLSFRSYRDGF